MQGIKVIMAVPEAALAPSRLLARLLSGAVAVAAVLIMVLLPNAQVATA